MLLTGGFWLGNCISVSPPPIPPFPPRAAARRLGEAAEPLVVRTCLTNRLHLWKQHLRTQCTWTQYLWTLHNQIRTFLSAHCTQSVHLACVSFALTWLRSQSDFPELWSTFLVQRSQSDHVESVVETMICVQWYPWTQCIVMSSLQGCPKLNCCSFQHNEVLS